MSRYVVDGAAASKARSVDVALQSFAHQKYGADLLGVIAFAVACSGV